MYHFSWNIWEKSWCSLQRHGALFHRHYTEQCHHSTTVSHNRGQCRCRSTLSLMGPFPPSPEQPDTRRYFLRHCLLWCCSKGSRKTHSGQVRMHHPAKSPSLNNQSTVLLNQISLDRHLPGICKQPNTIGC